MKEGEKEWVRHLRKKRAKWGFKTHQYTQLQLGRGESPAKKERLSGNGFVLG